MSDATSHRAVDMVDRVLSWCQFWLQGHGWGAGYRPRLAIRAGNRISDLRYAMWKRWGDDV